MSAPLPSLRPLNLGELIDRSVRLWRGRLGLLVRQMLPFVITAQLMMILADVLVIRDLEALLEAPELGRLVGALGLLGLLLMLNIWIIWLGQLRVARTLVPLVTGIAPASRGGGTLLLRGTLNLILFLSLMGLTSTLILAPTALAIAGGMALRDQLGMGPSIAVVVVAFGVGFLAWLAAALWWILRMSLALPLVATEEGGPLTLLKRGGRMLTGRVGPGLLGHAKLRAVLLVTVVGVLATIAQGIAGLPRLVLDTLYRDGGIPWLWRIPAEALVAGGQAVFTPMIVAGYVLYYVDQRVRREGLDLQIALERT